MFALHSAKLHFSGGCGNAKVRAGIWLAWSYRCRRNHMNDPIPTHLKTIFRVNENETNASNLSGSIVCDCGCEYFTILHNENRQYDPSMRYSEQDGLKVVAICNNCRKKHLIFDEATQGYNGLICGDFKTALDSCLSDYICHKCGSTIFSISLDIEIEDKEQFIEECVNEYPDKFSPDDYIDAFDWITISVCCKKCSKEIEWISLELS